MHNLRRQPSWLRAIEEKASQGRQKKAFDGLSTGFDKE